MQNHSEQNGSSSKRPQADDTAFQDNRPAKQPRLADQDSFSSQSSSQGSDQSNTRLVHSMLKKLRSQFHTRRHFPSPPNDISPDFIHIHASQLARFARHGGPDLRDLRGYPLPTMSAPCGSASKSLSQSRVTTTDATSIAKSTTTSRSVSAYQGAFNEILNNNQVHPLSSTLKPSQTVLDAIAKPHPSLSTFSCSDFDRFHRDTLAMTGKDDILDVFKTLISADRDVHPHSRNITLGNLKPLPKGSIVAAKPDLYYGSVDTSLDQRIRKALSQYICPSATVNRLIMPNFFLEVKGPDGSYGVAIQQARYDGALGARAIHALQNYGKEEPDYDGKAYVFSAVYQYGNLMLFAHSMTAPKSETCGLPEYHMTLIRSFSLLKDMEACVEGVAAFLNLRDLAKQSRERFICEAQSRLATSEDNASQSSTSRKRTPLGRESTASSRRKRAGAGHGSASGSSKRLRDTQSPSPHWRQASKNRK